MRILALDTDIDALKLRFLSHGEREVMTVYFHGFKFFMVLLRKSLITAALTLPIVLFRTYGIEIRWLEMTIGILWLAGVFPPFIKGFLDWQFDFIYVTTDKVVLVDQSSVFRHRIKPINLENIASVSVETQFWNLFSFGVLHLDLKEGTGESIRLPYIPRVHKTASKISDTVTLFQRSKNEPSQAA